MAKKAKQDKQLQSFRRKVKSIRRVSRMAAEYVLTDREAYDLTKRNSIATEQFGEDNTYQRAVFLATVGALENASFKPGQFAPKDEATA